LENELDEALLKHRTGKNRRKDLEYHMGREKGWEEPSGVKYLENLHQVIIPDLRDRIYNANNDIERLTSEIESLEPVAVPVAEDVEGGEEGDGKRRRKSRRRKSRRRKSLRERTHKHHTTRRNKRKSRKYH